MKIKLIHVILGAMIIAAVVLITLSVISPSDSGEIDCGCGGSFGEF